ncbi:MAG: FecR domain-containing protein [Lachnospiraceae bacterium]|nr:FecR domain-containing protein [Lachnospiraceae bacterium]
MNKKKLIIIISSVVALLGVAAAVFFLVFNKKGYRLLKVYEVKGQASVTRESIGEIEPYDNMVLESGDVVALDTGEMTLRADEDKYIQLEEHTKLKLVATGSSSKSKTTIDLMEGAITNDIQNKLSEGSSYDVNTPNSTMSVRGTIFRVQVYEENGVKYTKVSVFEGEVETKLVYKDGTIAEKAVSIQKGKEVIIYEDDKTTDYVSEPTDIDFDALDDKVLDLIRDANDKGRDVAMAEEEFEEHMKDTALVTFAYNGNVFATQTVKKGEKVQEPVLMPAPSGSWDYDFSKPVTEDITINWR